MISVFSSLEYEYRGGYLVTGEIEELSCSPWDLVIIQVNYVRVSSVRGWGAGWRTQGQCQLAFLEVLGQSHPHDGVVGARKLHRSMQSGRGAGLTLRPAVCSALPRTLLVTDSKSSRASAGGVTLDTDICGSLQISDGDGGARVLELHVLNPGGSW